MSLRALTAAAAASVIAYAAIEFLKRKKVLTFTADKAVENGDDQPERAMILGTGAAYGNHYSTEQMHKAFVEQRKAVGDTECDFDFAKRVFEACGYDAHSVTLPLKDVYRRMSRDEYIELRRTNLQGLAKRAGEDALASWGGDRANITHFFWGTMTGAMDSPTLDIKLTKALGLNPDVERTSIEGMGCLTGFRLLNLARQVAAAQPHARILVIAADLRSALGNALPEKATKEDIVSVALFRDAASSCVVGGSGALTSNEMPIYECITGLSRIIDDTSHLVDYHEETDGSIRLHLSRDLPIAIGAAEPAFVGRILEKAREEGFDVPKLKTDDDKEGGVEILQARAARTVTFDVLCHTGGPKVLREVAKCLGADAERLGASWRVMKAHGNLSGASNLAVLHEHSTRSSEKSDWAVCLSMGPGACLEGVLLRRLAIRVHRSSSVTNLTAM